MPGVFVAPRWGGDEYAQRFHESLYKLVIGHRFVSFDDFQPIVRTLIAQHASRPGGALLRDFQVLASLSQAMTSLVAALSLPDPHRRHLAVLLPIPARNESPRAGRVAHPPRG